MKLQNPKTFMDISIGGEKIGRMVFEAFADILPITSENFRALCTGELGLGYWRRPKHYKFTRFHRIIPGFMAQGGDYNCNNGYGGESIYGQFFRDEKHIYKHSRRGLLSMAKCPFRDSNNSQFFITFAPCSWLDGKHVVFGQLISGSEVLSRIEKEGTESGSPRHHVQIYNCGELTPSVQRTVGQDCSVMTEEEAKLRPDTFYRPISKDPYPIPKALWKVKQFL